MSATVLEQAARAVLKALDELEDVTVDDVAELIDAERAGRGRKTVLRALDRAAERAKPRARRDGEPPPGLDADLIAVWIAGRDTLKSDKRWNAMSRALLDQLAAAMNAARIAREKAADEPFVEGSTGQLVAHPGTRTAEAAEAKALGIANALLLTPDARARRGLADDEPERDPLDAIVDDDADPDS